MFDQHVDVLIPHWHQQPARDVDHRRHAVFGGEMHRFDRQIRRDRVFVKHGAVDIVDARPVPADHRQLDVEALDQCSGRGKRLAGRHGERDALRLRRADRRLGARRHFMCRIEQRPVKIGHDQADRFARHIRHRAAR